MSEPVFQLKFADDSHTLVVPKQTALSLWAPTTKYYLPQPEPKPVIALLAEMEKEGESVTLVPTRLKAADLQCMQRVLQFCTLFANSSERIAHIDKIADKDEAMPAWFVEFIDPIVANGGWKDIIELANMANYFGVGVLEYLTAIQIASMVKGKTQSQMENELGELLLFPQGEGRIKNSTPL